MNKVKGVYNGLIEQTKWLNYTASLEVDNILVDEQSKKALSLDEENRIWNAAFVIFRDQNATKFHRVIRTAPSELQNRGPVGETPPLMLSLYNTEGHINALFAAFETHPEMRLYLHSYSLAESDFANKKKSNNKSENENENGRNTTTNQSNQDDDDDRESVKVGTYDGENMLHIAIVKNNQKLFDFLMNLKDKSERDELINGRAYGGFFQDGEPYRRGECCYFGEYPLSFAVCMNRLDMVKILLENGANISAKDSNGNTCLHMLVYYPNKEIFDFLYDYIENQKEKIQNEYEAAREKRKQKGEKIEEDEEPSDDDEFWRVKNEAGLCVLALASKEGKQDTFNLLLDRGKELLWNYGPVSCLKYDLEELEDAIEIIIDNGNFNLLQHSIVKKLLTKKWDRFANRIFFFRLYFTVFYLLIFMFITLVNANKKHKSDVGVCVTGTENMFVNVDLDGVADSANNNNDSNNLPICTEREYSWVEWLAFTLGDWAFQALRLICEGFLIYGAYYKGLKECSEIMEEGWKYFQHQGSSRLENYCASSFCLGILICYVIRFTGFYIYYEDSALAVTSVIGWLYLLWFIMGFKKTGHVVIMIAHMVAKDLFIFSIIYVIFLFAFAQAFVIIFDDSGAWQWLNRMKTMFLVLLGEFDLDVYIESRYPIIATGLLLIYIVMVTILLMNVLIAQLGDTFRLISDAAEKQWLLERARIIASIESELNEDEKMKVKNSYSSIIKNPNYQKSVGKRYFGVQVESELCQ